MPLSIWARRHPSLLLRSLRGFQFCCRDTSQWCPFRDHNWAVLRWTEVASLSWARLADLPLHGAGCVKMFLIMLMMTSTPKTYCFLLLPWASENTLSRAAWWNFIETSLTLRQQHFISALTYLVTFFFFLFGKQIQCLMLSEDLGGVSGKSFFAFRGCL